MRIKMMMRDEGKKGQENWEQRREAMWGEGSVGIRGKGCQKKERGAEGQGKDHGETEQGREG